MMIAQGHLLVNGHKVDIASYLTRPGDKVTVKASARSQAFVKAQMELSGGGPNQGLADLRPVSPDRHGGGRSDAGQRADPGRGATDRRVVFAVKKENHGLH